MFIPGCMIAIALFIFTGKPHDPNPREPIFTTDSGPEYRCGIRIR